MPSGLLRGLLTCALPIVAFVGTGVASAGASGATTAAPYAVARASCSEYSAFGNTYNVTVYVEVYNLPASADGSTVVGDAAFPNTEFYVYQTGGSPGSVTGDPMYVSNGVGSGQAVLNLPAGPYDYSVAVLYKATGGTLSEPPGSADEVPPVQITLPAPSACGSANVTSTSSVPGTNVGPIAAMAPTPDGKGYWVAGSDGRVYAYGDASIPYNWAFIPSLNKPIVGMAATPSGHGFWLVASDGGIFSYGDAQFYGSTGSIHLNQPIVGMASTPDGAGYWLVAADGGVFSFGDAQFYGSTGSIHLNQPVVGMAPDDATGGYWLVAADGGVFSYNAPFLGSTGSIHLNKPIVGMEAAPDGSGYRFVASDGGVFCFGLAFAGSMGGKSLNAPIAAMAPSGSSGYWLGATDGGIFSFDAGFYGSAA